MPETAGAIRLFHFSDTHLGHQQYARTDATGLNQREVDLYQAFTAVIDAAVAQKPDLVIHAGDLFDGVRPSNRALACAQDGWLRLSRAGIPTVIIAGNHEHPKLRETGSALRLYAHIPGIHPVFAGAGETIELQVRGIAVRIHAVPQMRDNAALAAHVASLPARTDGDAGLDLLVVHGAVSTLKAFSHAEFNEQSLDPAWFDARFDYVALGHYHGLQEVVPRKAWYCGAPERVSMAEAGEEKGYLDVRVARGDSQAVFRPLAGRPYMDLPVLDASGLDAAAVIDAARQMVGRAPPASVVRLRMRNLDPRLRGGLDLRAIHDAARHTLHLDLSRLEWRESESHAPGSQSFGHLGDEFESFVSRTPVEGDRARLLDLGRKVLANRIPDDLESSESPADVASPIRSVSQPGAQQDGPAVAASGGVA